MCKKIPNKFVYRCLPPGDEHHVPLFIETFWNLVTVLFLTGELEHYCRRTHSEVTLGHRDSEGGTTDEPVEDEHYLRLCFCQGVALLAHPSASWPWRQGSDVWLPYVKKKKKKGTYKCMSTTFTRCFTPKRRFYVLFRVKFYSVENECNLPHPFS